jgi:UDP-glucose 4-epimerase
MPCLKGFILADMVENDIELFEGDIRSYHTVNRAVKGIEVILHEAALPSVPRSINDPITSPNTTSQ